jgi:hypothetical protein
MKCQPSALCVCVIMTMAVSAEAQVQRPPARSARDTRTGTQQAISLHGSLLGGYEDNLLPPTGGNILGTNPGGYTGFSDATLTYSIANAKRSLDASGNGYFTTYRNAGVGPRYGGSQKLSGQTRLGARTQLAATQELRYSPQFTLGLFSPLQSDLGHSNTENVTTALGEGGSWATALSALVDQKITRRTSVDGAYAYGTQRYVNGAGFDSRNQSGTLGYSQSFGRTASLRATYQNGKGEYEEARGTLVPITTRTANLGFNYQRRLSATRSLLLSGGSGASHVGTVDQDTGRPIDYWTPSGYGAVRLDVARSWSVSGDYRHSTTVLQGDTPQPFGAYTTQASVGGNLQRWLESVFSIGYSNGVSGLPSEEGGEGRYEGYTGTVQFRMQLSGGWSSVVSLAHFEYRLNAAASQSLGVAGDMSRNVVRVGLTWALPLPNIK